MTQKSKKSETGGKAGTLPRRGYKHLVSIYDLADRLGLSAGHVNAVLNGKATSKRVTDLYNALAAELKKGAAHA
jgi:transcriptional regulator with XRE-family HTH domain